MAVTDQQVEVEITSSFHYKGEQVTRFDCRSCGKAALVYTVDVGTVRQSEELRRTFCEQAVAAAALKYIAPE